jgi:integrase
MAYINQRGDFWRAEVRRKGYKPIYRTFDTRQEAQKWARLVESEMDSGLFVDRAEAENTLLSDALERYKREIVPTKRHPYQESRRIDRWLKNDLSYRTLANLRGADFARYRDERRDAGRAENTIRLELQIISHLYEIARKEWGMEGLINPLNNIRKPSGSRARDRRLLPGEYERIHACLAAHSNCYALPAFELAIETSLRQGTLFKLRWEWIDFAGRMIRLPNEARGPENKGVPPVLPMSSRTIAILQTIQPKDKFGGLILPGHGLVLNTTANAVVCAWKRTMIKLGINDLRWHDLRHEATSRLFEKGLHPMEVASITGHKSMQMLKRYTHLKPETLLLKLG